MKKAPIPADEQRRLDIIKSLDLLNERPEDRLDHITKMAVEKLHTPISTITIIDKDKEIYKSHQGTDVKSGPRDISFCGHTLLEDKIFIIEDTLNDARFKDNPYVLKKPPIRFYAGICLKDKQTNISIGALCIKDYNPRKLTKEEMNLITELGKEAEYELNRESHKINN